MDIKENNILISHCPENQLNPLTGYLPIKFKLGDFGISVDFKSQRTNVSLFATYIYLTITFIEWWLCKRKFRNT